MAVGALPRADDRGQPEPSFEPKAEPSAGSELTDFGLLWSLELTNTPFV